MSTEISASLVDLFLACFPIDCTDCKCNQFTEFTNNLDRVVFDRQEFEAFLRRIVRSLLAGLFLGSGSAVPVLNVSLAHAGSVNSNTSFDPWNFERDGSRGEIVIVLFILLRVEQTPKTPVNGDFVDEREMFSVVN